MDQHVAAVESIGLRRPATSVIAERLRVQASAEREIMWTDEDGELHEEPVAWRETAVADRVQAMVERMPEGARDRYSDWMDEEMEALGAYARELVAGGLVEEASYRNRPVPAVELQRISWASIGDLDELEAALRSVPPRWRLDVMFIVEDAFDANRPPKPKFRLRDLWDALSF